jgi:(S)-2-hydroxyglutarate dehydrogenase
VSRRGGAGRARVVVVGGGIVGLATAYRLLQALPGLDLVVLEKEADVGRHQSGHNSGVLHAGLYYRPGSAKARLAVRGIRQMVAFCREHGVPHEVCGKLVVAVTPEELPRLHDLHERGTANGLAGLELLGPEQMREVEPHAAGVAALRVPEEGIVDYPRVCAVLAELVRAAGGQVRTGAEVQGFRRARGERVVESTAGAFAADFVVTCGGLHADRLARMAGDAPGVRIVPFRGEYYTLRPQARGLVRNLVYPVPDPAFPFLGVHFTRMVRGGVEAGPNAVLALSREGYRRGQLRPGDALDALTFPGLARFVLRYPAAVAAELARSLSRRRFADSLRRLVPAVRDEDLAPGGAGVRAQAMRADGTLVEDFWMVDGRDALHVLNAPSPAATASLAIGGEIAARVAGRLGAAPLAQGSHS